jgi:hypothetical protein
VIGLTSVVRKNDAYCERTLGEETVFMSPDGSQVHALNDVGSAIWSFIDGTITLAEIRDRICQEYDVGPDQAERDLLAFVRELVAKQLLLVDPA